MDEKIATTKLNEIIELAVIAKECIENEDWDEVIKNNGSDVYPARW